MTYEETVRYLYERLPVFSRIGKAALKPDLGNITKLTEALGNPHRTFKSIHIAGTNGKGSTSHALAAVLQQAGFKTGLHTSPHLLDLRERIKINGECISKEWVIDFVEQHKQQIETIQPSFFEIMVAMAFKAFAEQEVDYAVIETGLGGRLDSTNILQPVLSIITNISYDHQDLLGDTLEKIAAEKAGIIKPHTPVLIGNRQKETEKIFFETALKKHSTVHYADALWDLVRTKQEAGTQYFKAVQKAKMEIVDIRTDLTGIYQLQNLRTVLAASEMLNHLGLNLPLQTVTEAFSKVKQLTGLSGRWEQLHEQPLIIADVAHNVAGITEVMQQWNQIGAKRKHIVTGFVRDKDVDQVLNLFPKDQVYHFCAADIPRAMPVAELQGKAAKMNLSGLSYDSVAEAVLAAQEQMKQDDALLITGSFFIVGEAIQALKEK